MEMTYYCYDMHILGVASSMMGDSESLLAIRNSMSFSSVEVVHALYEG